MKNNLRRGYCQSSSSENWKQVGFVWTFRRWVLFELSDGRSASARGMWWQSCVNDNDDITMLYKLQRLVPLQFYVQNSLTSVKGDASQTSRQRCFLCAFVLQFEYCATMKWVNKKKKKKVHARIVRTQWHLRNLRLDCETVGGRHPTVSYSVASVCISILLLFRIHSSPTAATESNNLLFGSSSGTWKTGLLGSCNFLFEIRLGWRVIVAL